MKSHIHKSWSMIRVLVPAMGLAAIVTAAEPAPVPAVAEARAAAFALPAMPYAQDALAPYVSARTMGFHYAKHHQAFVQAFLDHLANWEFAAAQLK